MLETCSFCNKTSNDVAQLLAGTEVRICDECVKLCKEIIADDPALQNVREPAIPEMYPKQIKQFLDQHIIGQDHAKKVLSVAVYNHYKRLNQHNFDSDFFEFEEDIEITKGNVLLIGPTGSGKTLMAKSLAKRLDVPFTIADATSLTEAGYVGEDVENIIKALWIAADRDPEKTGRGIICIDEIDKLGSKGGGTRSARDVGGEGVQQALLKMVESSNVSISPEGSRNKPQQDFVQIDTSNILFIACGSFEGLEAHISRRLGKSRVGFSAEPIEKDSIRNNKILRQVVPKDLQHFGLIPEFIGRFPVIVTFDQLEEDQLVEILWKPKNSLISQYQKLMQLNGVKLHFDHDALVAMVQEAVKRKTGARGLRAIIENVMLDIMYEVPSLKDVREVIVTERCITNDAAPSIIRDEEETAA